MAEKNIVDKSVYIQFDKEVLKSLHNYYRIIKDTFIGEQKSPIVAVSESPSAREEWERRAGDREHVRYNFSCQTDLSADQG